MTLTKADFSERLFDELGLDKREAKKMVELFFEEIKGSLEQGKQVKISAWFK
jgi:integration host factor subunit alpha